MLVVRCIRPDTVVASVAEYVAGRLGREFIEPIPFNLKDVYKDSTRTTPLIFVLSPGSDPFRSLKEFADSKRKNLYAKSLG